MGNCRACRSFCGGGVPGIYELRCKMGIFPKPGGCIYFSAMGGLG